MHPKSWILFCAVFTVCTVLAEEPDLIAVIVKIKNLSKSLLIGTQEQVGGLFLYEVENDIPFFNPSPATDNGMLQITNDHFAPELSKLNNYLVAKPMPYSNPDNPKQKLLHTEGFVLKNNGDKVLDEYRQNHGRAATHAVFYTHFVPCSYCADHVLNFKQRHPYLKITLAYTTSYNLNTDKINLNKFAVENISLINIPCDIQEKRKKRSAGIPVCHFKSFQGCLLDQLNNFCCFQNHTDKVVFVNAFAAECFPDYNKACSDSLIEVRFSACSSRKEKLQSSFDNLVQTCSLKALSNPQLTSGSSVFTGTLRCANCLQTPPKSCSLKQVSACGHRGALCTTTAGNSMCRDDHYCGLHRESYSWCYIDDEDNWDYCCLGSCKMDSQKDAMMCYAGQATDLPETAIYTNCGDAGTQTVTGENCDASHPCGTHNGTDYYWCYTQSGLGWDYCCRPDQVCGKKGQDFNWCLVGRNSSRIECNPAREAECDNKTFDEEERCPCNNTCSSQGPASESPTVVAAMPVLVLQSLLVCSLVATHLFN